MATKFVAFLFAFFALSYASSVVRNINVIPLEAASPRQGPQAKKIANITRLSRQDVTQMAVDSSQNGFARITRVGINVIRGAEAELDFDITVNAVDARTLDRASESFVETLSEFDRSRFLELQENFDGGLRIPIFVLLGLDLSKTFTAEQIEEVSQNIEHIETDFSLLSEILESVSDTRTRINGSLTATGVSNIPTVAFAFINVAKIQFTDESSQLVVSTRDEDAIAAGRRGEPVDSSDQDIDVVCVSGFFC